MKTNIHKLTLVLLCAVALSGCRTNPLAAPAAGVRDTILPEYTAYVEADPVLDPTEKRIRLNNAQAFKLAVDEFEGK